jgi:hypothetical protein
VRGGSSIIVSVSPRYYLDKPASASINIVSSIVPSFTSDHCNPTYMGLLSIQSQNFRDSTHDQLIRKV